MVETHSRENFFQFFRNAPTEMQQLIRNISDPNYISLTVKLEEYNQRFGQSVVRAFAELGYVPPYNDEEMKADKRCDEMLFRLKNQLCPEGMNLVNQLSIYENCPGYIFSQQPENGNQYSQNQLKHWELKIYFPFLKYLYDESRAERQRQYSEMWSDVALTQWTADMDELQLQKNELQLQIRNQRQSQLIQPQSTQPQPTQQRPQSKKPSLGMRMLKGTGKLLAKNYRYAQAQEAERQKGRKYYCRICKRLQNFSRAGPHSCCGKSMLPK
jgi:hypothetical protein